MLTCGSYLHLARVVHDSENETGWARSGHLHAAAAHTVLSGSDVSAYERLGNVLHPDLMSAHGNGPIPRC